jgi:hypothetical protein
VRDAVDQDVDRDAGRDEGDDFAVSSFPRPPPWRVKVSELPGVSTPSVAISVGGMPSRNALSGWA